MQCKDCINFKNDSRMEAGAEISPRANDIKGTCNVSNKNCSAMDNCGCGSFTRR